MKIALLNCNPSDVFQNYPIGAFRMHHILPPLGLCSIAAGLIERGHQVRIYDQHIDKGTDYEFAEDVVSFHPNLIGFSCTSINIDRSISCLKIIRNKNNNAYAVAGGIHPTILPKETLNDGMFHAVISGEGEIIFADLADNLELHGSINIRSPGFWSANKTGCGVAVLDRLIHGIPRRDLLRIEDYGHQGSLLTDTPTYSLFQSRGCPFYCRFCSKPSYHKNYRIRPLELTFQEIDSLINDYGAKSLCFREDNFTGDRNHLIEFCLKFKRRYGDSLKWECESKADLPRNLLEIMSNSGCQGIWSGIESIVPRWQIWLGKHIPADIIKRFYSDCQKLGIRTGALFIFGFPSQTEKELDTDIRFAIDLHCSWRYFQLLVIFPGSMLAAEYSRNKLYHKITPFVAIALTKGKDIGYMMKKERVINEEIRIN